MAFEKGNQHGAKSRAFDNALRRAIAQDDGKRLREAAEKLLTLAAGGESWAIKELADRLDGKTPAEVRQDVNVAHSGSIEHRTVPDTSSWIAESLARSQVEVPPGTVSH